MAQVLSLRVDCFTCLKKVGEVRHMEEIHPGVFFCAFCKNVKQLDNRIAFSPIGILSMSSLPLLNVASASFFYLARHMPLELQAGAGAFLFVGYLLKGLKVLGR